MCDHTTLSRLEMIAEYYKIRDDLGGDLMPLSRWLEAYA